MYTHHGIPGTYIGRHTHHIHPGTYTGRHTHHIHPGIYTREAIYHPIHTQGYTPGRLYTTMVHPGIHFPVLLWFIPGLFLVIPGLFPLFLEVYARNPVNPLWSVRVMSERCYSRLFPLIPVIHRYSLFILFPPWFKACF